MDGEKITSIVDFSLKESVGEHASFTVTIRTDVLEKLEERKTILGESRKYLNQILTFQLRPADTENNLDSLDFKGIITSMQPLIGYEGLGYDVIEFSGYGCSIILDDGCRYRSFAENSLSGIAKEAIGMYDQSKLRLTIAPENNSTLLYSVMHNESRFAYLKRLAISHGEYLLYNQDTLYFGKPDFNNELILNYGTDLTHFKINATPKQGKITYFSHNYHSEEHTTSSTDSNSTSGQGATSTVSNIAQRLYTDRAHVSFPGYEHSDLKPRLDQLVDKQNKVNEQQQIIIQAQSTHLAMTLGKVITIKSEKGSFGSYRITSLSHHVTGTGGYMNQFEAVPLEIDVFPLTDIGVFCSAHSHMATIVDTNDPEGMSRVKIRYPFDDATGVNSPWIRVATPYAGNDYGMHAIPEIGTSVLINYHQGNVEQPYVAASFYTGVNKYSEWQSEQNDFKGWHTKGGHKIELKDTRKGEMITITDKNGNKIIIDTANNNMEISALETMTIRAKNIEMIAEEHIDIQAQGHINTASQGDTAILAEGTATLQSTGDTHIQSDGSVRVQAVSDAVIKGQSVIAEGETTATLKGLQTKVQGQQATIQGATGKTDYI
ncbi:phage baseplate assembly protein V [Aquimarina muelleri]|uniref:phage baseplate assembly protein V n=1 Tax=Aquimarina muelleri TaxID=279356 RepID=UPI003F688D35